jgi:hypothetical protein
MEHTPPAMTIAEVGRKFKSTFALHSLGVSPGRVYDQHKGVAELGSALRDDRDEEIE